ncbi:MAG: U32 family peptidase [Bacteroidales bacterium]|nr:U32 family peptidase [Bacteroidales bacterium]
MQPVKLELLAPAKNKDIGIAAIDCGADAVYIAGPAFGARAAAGNPVSEIAQLCDYAHRFSAKIYATVNTIVFEDEIAQAQELIRELYSAGVDALIVQDLGITRMALPPIELHASTQCAIRTPQQAVALERLGFTRLILERQLSLPEIRAIREAVGCELEFFVHGAICVSYSGNCYLSQYLTGRSANRGACIQACRSYYDVVDAEGRVLARDRSILSPKDYCLAERLEELADAGICSFKIEGRLKSGAYVKNLVRYYRSRLDSLLSRRPEYVQASSGVLEGGFTPNPAATFNRGYTEFYIDGSRARWNSLESTKSIGEYIGAVVEAGRHCSLPGGKTSEGQQDTQINGAPVRYRCFAQSADGQRNSCQRQSSGQIVIEAGKQLFSGDGLVFVRPQGGIIGMRADVVDGDRITFKSTEGIAAGDKVYRNYNIKFEKELQANMPRRKIDVEVVFGQDSVTAVDADGYEACLPLPADAPLADKQEAAADNIRRNMGKRTGHFDFLCSAVAQSPVRFYPAAALNALRRDLADGLVNARLGARQKSRGGKLSDTQRDTQSACTINECKHISQHADNQSDTLHACESVANGSFWRQVPPQRSQALTGTADYTVNCANHLAREVLADMGYEKVEDAYELRPVADAALMRSRYCVKYELGLCPKLRSMQDTPPSQSLHSSHDPHTAQDPRLSQSPLPAQKVKEPLWLVNAGKKLRLTFDCKRCEMTVQAR